MSKIKVTDIGFFNRDGEEDETEFDTWDQSELADCWFDFCFENGIIAYVVSKEVEEDG
jgi:hypothetical protein